MAVKERIAQARKAAGLSQKELARMIGVNPPSISDWEKGRAEPDTQKTAKVLDALNIDANYLYQDYLSDQNNTERFLPLSLVNKLREVSDRDLVMIEGIIDLFLGHSPETPQQRRHEIVQQAPIENVIDLDFYFGSASAGLGEILDAQTPSATITLPYTPQAAQADFAIQISGNSMVPRFQHKDLVLIKKQPMVEEGQIGIFYIDGQCFIKQKKGSSLHSLNPAYPDIPLDESAICFGRVISKISPDSVSFH